MSHWRLYLTQLWFLLVFIIFSVSSFAGKELLSGVKVVKICTDTNYWYPYTFMQEGKSTGLHIDIVTRVFSEMGISLEFTPLPWKRCLAETRFGVYDAVVSASYKVDRAPFYHYPDDAEKARSDYRITQVEYTVISPIETKYDYINDLSTLPQPVTISLGYSVVDELKRHNLQTRISPKSSLDDAKLLLRYRKGSMVAARSVAKIIVAAHPDELYLSKGSFHSRSYHLIFSKKSEVGAADRQQIWKRLAKIREDEVLMRQLMTSYVNRVGINEE